MRSLNKKIIFFAKRILKEIRYKLFTKHIICDVRELFFQQNKLEFQRYDIIVRYLAIENYYKKNDFGFDLYRKMQAARVGKKWASESVKIFKTLILSYENNGYDTSSEIEIDKNINLVDGSHRMAMAIYHKSYQISCKIRPNIMDIYYGIDWFIEKGFSIREIILIQEKYNEIHNKLIIPFICILWPPVQNYFDEIVELLKISYKIIDYKDFIFDNDQFQAIVKNIYSVDDIESWKIEKKIEMMQSCSEKRIRVIRLNIEKPVFRLKNATLKTLSQEGEKIKRIFTNAYKDKVSNYFNDIIIHIGDNYFHNNHVIKLFYEKGK